LADSGSEIREEVLVGISKMFAYFLIARIIFENIYVEAGKEEQEKIDRWRDDDPINDVVSAYHKNIDDEKDWTVIFREETLEVINIKLTLLAEDKDEHTDLIRGKTAYPGFVNGRVRLIFSKDDLDIIQNGEILVTNMTTPEFVPALQKVGAFITDEGGITSHAAIVAREMKIPCIIGTKNATQKLKDGDEVEVDATNGIVKIIK
jgi:phosphoenolpyruvate synthase/pyruvate phosphate dikinase